MPKKTGPLCCMVNPTATCRICRQSQCTTHRNPESFSVCKKNRCLTLARREDEIAHYKREADRIARRNEWAKELGAKPEAPDTTSNGYRLLKKIESKRKS